MCTVALGLMSDAAVARTGPRTPCLKCVQTSKNGLKSAVSQKFQFKVQSGLGQGGVSGDYLSAAAVKYLHGAVGYHDSEKASQTWTMCWTASKKAGWDMTKYKKACGNKGQTFFFLRRNNGRVFGGYMKPTLTFSNRGYTCVAA